MGEEYVDQHYVPQGYLKRFGRKNTNNNGYHVAVKRKDNKSKKKYYPKAVDEIAYEKYLYDVSYLDDPKYWEHYFCNEIEPLYGDTLTNIIARIILSGFENYILSDLEREQLSLMLVFQFARVPSFFKTKVAKGPNICKEVKKEVIEKYNSLISKEQKYIIESFEPEKDFAKNVILETISAGDYLNKFIDVLKEGVFLLYYNETELPFYTSDNPVVLYNYMTKSLKYIDNGIANSSTIIYYPLSPKVMLRVVPKGYKLLGLDIIDGSVYVLKTNVKDFSFVCTVNDLQIEHATSEVYIPPQFLEDFNLM